MGTVAAAAGEPKPPLKLIGRDGNAFAILGQASHAAKKACWSKERWAKVRAEATSGDYNHLLQTLMQHFEVN
jgi:hypothetical protein